MNRWIIGGVMALAAVSTAARAQSPFCVGFEAGWRAGFQNHNRMAAITPICPIPAIGGDSYQAGFERGLVAALGYMAQHGG